VDEIDIISRIDGIETSATSFEGPHNPKLDKIQLNCPYYFRFKLKVVLALNPNKF